jgi:tRNA pseudouridine38-40 synthase
MLNEKIEQTWRLWVAYHGGALHGWQMQAEGLRTVESELRDAFKKLLGHDVIVRSAGRTDSGVHARAQAVSCRFASRFDARKLVLALSTVMPDDIAVFRAEKMPEGFDAQKAAIGKRYTYRVYQGLVADPFSHTTSWFLKRPLNIEAMKEAALHLVGHLDYESFRSAYCQASHARRYLWKIGVHRQNSHVEIDVRGNAFCHNQVRIMVGTLVEVGLGHKTPASLLDILAARDRTKAGRTAPAHGLTLEEVYYPDDLSAAQIPEGAVFPRYPVMEDAVLRPSI